MAVNVCSRLYVKIFSEFQEKTTLWKDQVFPHLYQFIFKIYIRKRKWKLWKSSYLFFFFYCWLHLITWIISLWDNLKVNKFRAINYLLHPESMMVNFYIGYVLFPVLHAFCRTDYKYCEMCQGKNGHRICLSGFFTRIFCSCAKSKFYEMKVLCKTIVFILLFLFLKSRKSFADCWSV